MFNYNEKNESECEFIVVASAGEVPNGGRLFVEIDGESIVIFNIAGSLFAIGDVCSHDDGPLGDGTLEKEYEIACPRHGARFDVRTGKVLALPAVVDIPAYPVRVIDGQIEIGLPAVAGS
ncbi:MAG TPA: non-heme iron oxygenase ferredoxin subunit [Anaerolineales bacterium]|nr:non-heme iron oxygenase ferredoxin subunit [Anaerolineales bacterium]